MKDTRLVKIGLYLAKDNDGRTWKCSAYMMIPVPLGADKEEYIQDFLDNMLNEDARRGAEWNYE